MDRTVLTVEELVEIISNTKSKVGERMQAEIVLHLRLLTLASREAYLTRTREEDGSDWREQLVRIRSERRKILEAFH